MKTYKELSNQGYREQTSIELASTDREPERILEQLDVKSFDEITIEHPKAKKYIEIIVESMKNKGQSLEEGGEWMVYRSHNDIAWTFVTLGYVVFEEKESVVKCTVINEDNQKTLIYLKEVTAPKKADFKYFNADGSKFDGQVLESDSFDYYKAE